MGLLGRKANYDRRRLLESAVKATRKGKARRAIKAYRRVLEVEPHDYEIHRKIAPLLARVGKEKSALESFARAVEGLVERGSEDHALGVCTEAVGFYPRRVELWEQVAKLRLKASSASAALAALLEGRGHFKRRKQVPDAIRLLERAHEIAPENAEVSLDLARMLTRGRQRARARALLDELEPRLSPPMLKQLRAARFRNDPSLAAWWRMLRGS